ncbi:zinc carboxypeptidase, putative [Leishmania tarentolae]|uniref:Zinc carboxypeptidase, putative n=1 Tax=Leishmania tarentolae TaxID=5689 RepID=A0A640KQU5_LEITA|nr:zinc carboxypeptidase, putative [Leishmania tarentolae]
MNLRSRSSRPANQRTPSTSVRDRDSGDGVSGQPRSSALQPRPPAIGGRSSSTSKGTKGAQKCSPPAASVSKRAMAKRLALRTRLPYLRSIPPLPASTNAEHTVFSLRFGRRSFSSCAVPREAARMHKSTYTIIPEVLQHVRQLCNSMRDVDRDASLPMGACGGNGARDRRNNRLASSPIPLLPEDATAVVQDIEMVQDMLFSSLQSGSIADSASPSMSSRDAAGAQPQRGRSHSWNSQRGLNYTHAGSGIFLSKKERKKAWAVFLHKNTQAFTLIVNACRSSLAMREPQVGSVLLTFLYNVLKHLSPEKQRKAVILCEKLGIIRVCTSVLQEGRRRLRPGDAVDAAAIASIRACEAAALLFTLGSTFNVKLGTLFRLSQSLECTLTCASVTFRLLEIEFAKYHASMQSDLCQSTTAAALQEYMRSHTRKETLLTLRRFQSHTQWTCTAFSHFCFSLFAFTGNAAAAVDLGTRGAELCATAIAMSTFFLTQIAPLLLMNVKYDASEKTRHSDAGSMTSISDEHWVPSWVMRLMRRVEFMLLWCVALMQRMTGFDKVRQLATDVALRFHVPRGIVFYLLPPSRHVLQMTPRRECVHVILLLLNTLLQADREAVLEDIKDLGGLKVIVASILALSEKSSQQWHHFYLQLCSMYGYTLLPSCSGRPACYVDERLPPSLRHQIDVAKTPIEKSFLPEPVSSSRSAMDTRAEASQASLSSPPASTSQCAGLSTETASESITSSFTAARLGRGGSDDYLLLVDTRPEVFSPELRNGDVEPMSELAVFEHSKLPWPFTDVPPPTTAEGWYGASSRVATTAEDAHLSVSLVNVSEEDRVRVLRHHIARLTLLEETACDGGPTPHVHKVVFERLSSALPGAAGDAAGTVQPSADGIEFFSDYESGNLQRAVEVSDSEYDLVLSWDTATNSYTQWFSFGVRHFTAGKTYRFNILNMEKGDSTFNEGQKPLLLHVPAGGNPPDPSAPRPQWIRVGEGIFYFGNAFLRPERAHYFGKNGETSAATATSPLTVSARTQSLAGNVSSPLSHLGGRAPAPVIAKRRIPAPPTLSPPLPTVTTSAESGVLKKKRYFTVSFSVTMPTTVPGTVYLANCFPFTYTEMREHLAWLASEAPACPGRSLLSQSLCWTPGGLQVPLLTVTSMRNRETGEPYTADEIRRRPIALLVARVHPGETNASWVMQGLLDTLLCPPAGAAEYASNLCDNFVFKVIPMLNADGVIMGNHRCSFAGTDLNRDYTNPTADFNPTLYAMKQLLRYWTGGEKRRVVMFADFHGHSRAKNFLVYGCTMSTIRGVATNSRHKSRRYGDGRRRRGSRKMSSTAPAGPEKVIAALLSQLFPSFSLSQSSFAVTKDKKGSARVVLYDEFGVRMSYGFEATMVGGLVCVPELLRLSTETHRADSASPASAMCKKEVHYSPTVFRSMGDVFLRALSILFQQWAALTALEADGGYNARKGSMNDVLKSAALQLSWSMTAAAGGGRDPPKNPSSSSTREHGVVPPRAGQYAAATRGDRRVGSPLRAGSSAALSEADSGLSVVPIAGQVEALDYLFMADCREGAMPGEDEDGKDEESIASDSDISIEEDSVDAEVDDDELPAITSLKQTRRGQAEHGETQYTRNTSKFSDLSESSPAVSGSDDEDWSGCISSGSAAGGSNESRSSVSSVDEEIPTNLFM